MFGVIHACLVHVDNFYSYFPSRMWKRYTNNGNMWFFSEKRGRNWEFVVIAYITHTYIFATFKMNKYSC